MAFFYDLPGSKRVIRCAIAVCCLAIQAIPASAVTFQIDFSNGSGTDLGEFEASAAGGPVSGLTATIGGVFFDSMIPGTTSFDYDPAINEFTYSGAFPSYTNSTPYPICGPGECFLEIYPDPDPLVPGDYLAIDKDLNNIGPGTKYVILPPAPIPLPPALGLLALGVGSLAFVGRKRRPGA